MQSRAAFSLMLYNVVPVDDTSDVVRGIFGETFGLRHLWHCSEGVHIVSHDIGVNQTNDQIPSLGDGEEGVGRINKTLRR